VAVKKRKKAARTRRRARAPEASPQHITTPHLCLLRAPPRVSRVGRTGREFVVATYNVHRWTGLNGRGRPDPARAGFVISALDADVIALQEVPRPLEGPDPVLRPLEGPDPLQVLADALGFHVAFAATRVHKRGELGNAILSRWPLAGVLMIDLSFSRLERRVAVTAQFGRGEGRLYIVATHLALGDRTRHRQVRSLLDHPQLRDQPTVLMGDMNAWRRCRAMRALDDELRDHDNPKWPASFPSARPVLALDRIYSRGVRLVELAAHKSRAARRASDHLPIVARVRI
jgi:endonuclease/exonuclease/phosphatase family metal-dependent hydrolase